ncbi:MAG: hypothetical protein WC422_02270 [Candidatus Paceibacterota bacterium]|jgi:hypothetical protein
MSKNIIANVSIDMAINPNRQGKIEGKIQMSCRVRRPGKNELKMVVDYYFNNHPENILKEGQEVDIDFVVDRRRHNIKYVYPNRTLNKTDFRIYTLWQSVGNIIGEMMSNPYLKNKDALISYSATHMIDKDTFQILLDPF